jgi:hypothetical protein
VQNESAPTTGALPNFIRAGLQAAALVGLTSRTLLELVIGIARPHRLRDLAYEVDVQEPILQAGTPPGRLRLASCVPGHKESPAINFSTPIVLRARHSK